MVRWGTFRAFTTDRMKIARLTFTIAVIFFNLQVGCVIVEGGVLTIVVIDELVIVFDNLLIGLRIRPKL